MKIARIKNKEIIDNVVPLRGSKSITNRALIISLLTDDESTLENYSSSEDSKTIIEFFRKMNAKIEELDEKTIKIQGIRSKLPTKKEIIHNVGPAGTAARFLTAFCARFCEGVTLDGSERMRERPMKPLLEVLEKLGAEFEYLGEKYHLPFKINSTIKNISNRTIEIPGNISSQFVTALLLISPFLDNIEIKITDGLVSEPYVDMTIDTMNQFGVKVVKYKTNQTIKLKVQSGKYHGIPYFIEGDASSATYLWGLAAISGKKIGVQNIFQNSIQPDFQFVYLLEKMGCKVLFDDRIVYIKGSSNLKNLEIVDMSSMPDSAQTLACVLATTKCKTRLTGLSTLRDKETDRISALENELKKLGANTFVNGDELIIESDGMIRTARIETYKDHRMAMAFGILGAKTTIEILDPDVVNKSFPEFFEVLKNLGLEIEFIEE